MDRVLQPRCAWRLPLIALLCFVYNAAVAQEQATIGVALLPSVLSQDTNTLSGTVLYEHNSSTKVRLFLRMKLGGLVVGSTNMRAPESEAAQVLVNMALTSELVVGEEYRLLVYLSPTSKTSDAITLEEKLIGVVAAPTAAPVEAPTALPTEMPTTAPTFVPTTAMPTSTPTAIPTSFSSFIISGGDGSLRSPEIDPSVVPPGCGGVPDSTTGETECHMIVPIIVQHYGQCTPDVAVLCPGHCDACPDGVQRDGEAVTFSTPSPTSIPTTSPTMLFEVLSTTERCDKSLASHRSPFYTLDGSGFSLLECTEACQSQPPTDCMFVVLSNSGVCQMFTTCDVRVSTSRATTYMRAPGGPTSVPTSLPTFEPSVYPTAVPTSEPTVSPTANPTEMPTSAPSEAPTAAPSNEPTHAPSISPSKAPTSVPTETPTLVPTSTPSSQPTGQPSVSPTATPTEMPSTSPTSNPTANPTVLPTAQPTSLPTTASPTSIPTASPTSAPSTSNPTFIPTSKPTRSPTTAAPTPTNTLSLVAVTGLYLDFSTTIDFAVELLHTDPRPQQLIVRLKRTDTGAIVGSSTFFNVEADMEVRTRVGSFEVDPSNLILGVEYRFFAMLTPTGKKSAAILETEMVNVFVSTISPTSPTTVAPSTAPSNHPTSVSPTDAPTYAPSTASPTRIPTTPQPTTRTPSIAPSRHPTTQVPTPGPTYRPTSEPTTLQPTRNPTRSPSRQPTRLPTQEPTSRRPTQTPTRSPTAPTPPTRAPWAFPTIGPTTFPTFRESTSTPEPENSVHTAAPSSHSPTNVPSARPTPGPTMHPCTTGSDGCHTPSTLCTSDISSNLGPILGIGSSRYVCACNTFMGYSQRISSFYCGTAGPTLSPSRIPTTQTPSVSPTRAPSTSSPTEAPSQSPTTNAPTTQEPTRSPTHVPTTNPTTSPTNIPTLGPTSEPSISPSSAPSERPSATPSHNPTTGSPSSAPSMGPTGSPTVMPSAECEDLTAQCTSYVEAGLCDPLGLFADYMNVFCRLSCNICGPNTTVSPTSASPTSPTLQPTAVPSNTPTSLPSAAPSKSPTSAPTASPTTSPTTMPSTAPTVSPTSLPSESPTSTPTSVPSASPSAVPSENPSASPTSTPSAAPSAIPTELPSAEPTATPSGHPTATPSGSPTAIPTAIPTVSPSGAPTSTPTSAPTSIPSSTPSSYPTATPTLAPTVAPSASPTSAPTAVPSLSPSASPTATPSLSPSASPTSVPSAEPTASPSVSPSSTPTAVPTSGPTASPSTAPSFSPTSSPSVSPSQNPTALPSVNPSASPSSAPTLFPTEGPSVSPSSYPTIAPTLSPSSAPSSAPSRSPTASPSSTPSSHPTATPTLAPSAAPSAFPTSTPTALPSLSPSASPTAAPSLSPSAGPTSVPSAEPTASPSAAPSATPTSIPSSEPTASPSAAPSSGPTASPSLSPSARPTATPTLMPSASPSAIPTGAPSAAPSLSPSASPSENPTSVPSVSPSAAPSANPTGAPTALPTQAPTSSPTSAPSAAPTASPSASPTAIPSEHPTSHPTASPTAAPSAMPTKSPTMFPTATPTSNPTSIPTAMPSSSPTAQPTLPPTSSPTEIPTSLPTLAPTAMPTAAPTSNPTVSPSAEPTLSPTAYPTGMPTASPSAAPSHGPTSEPTTAQPTQVPTSFPTEGPTIPCIDLNAGCPSYREIYGCEEGTLLYSFLVLSCRATCRYCEVLDTSAPTAVTESPTTPSVLCMDRLAHCRSWASANAGFCHPSSDFFEYMSENCAQTCGTCASTTQSPLSSSPTIASRTSPPTLTTATPSTAPTPPCTNLNSNCDRWSSSGYGYCNPTSSYSAFMATNCRQACGFCHIVDPTSNSLVLSMSGQALGEYSGSTVQNTIDSAIQREVTKAIVALGSASSSIENVVLSGGQQTNPLLIEVVLSDTLERTTFLFLQELLLNCQFCVVLENKLHCAHELNGDTCEVPSQCRDHITSSRLSIPICPVGTLCRPDMSQLPTVGETPFDAFQCVELVSSPTVEPTEPDSDFEAVESSQSPLDEVSTATVILATVLICIVAMLAVLIVVQRRKLKKPKKPSGAPPKAPFTYSHSWGSESEPSRRLSEPEWEHARRPFNAVDPTYSNPTESLHRSEWAAAQHEELYSTRKVRPTAMELAAARHHEALNSARIQNSMEITNARKAWGEVPEEKRRDMTHFDDRARSHLHTASHSAETAYDLNSSGSDLRKEPPSRRRMPPSRPPTRPLLDVKREEREGGYLDVDERRDTISDMEITTSNCAPSSSNADPVYDKAKGNTQKTGAKQGVVVSNKEMRNWNSQPVLNRQRTSVKYSRATRSEAADYQNASSLPLMESYQQEKRQPSDEPELASNAESHNVDSNDFLPQGSKEIARMARRIGTIKAESIAKYNARKKSNGADSPRKISSEKKSTLKTSDLDIAPSAPFGEDLNVSGMPTFSDEDELPIFTDNEAHNMISTEDSETEDDDVVWAEPDNSDSVPRSRSRHSDNSAEESNTEIDTEIDYAHESPITPLEAPMIVNRNVFASPEHEASAGDESTDIESEYDTPIQPAAVNPSGYGTTQKSSKTVGSDLYSSDEEFDSSNLLSSSNPERESQPAVQSSAPKCTPTLMSPDHYESSDDEEMALRLEVAFSSVSSMHGGDDETPLI